MPMTISTMKLSVCTHLVPHSMAPVPASRLSHVMRPLPCDTYSCVPPGATRGIGFETARLLAERGLDWQGAQ